MYITGNSYSNIQFDTHMRKRAIQKIKTYLPQIMKKAGADSVAVTGKSGISIAFATLETNLPEVWEFPLLVVRKDAESSHGNKVEGTLRHDFRKYVILDDFICTGATVSNIIEAIETYHKGIIYSYHSSNPSNSSISDKPCCVGVVEYNNGSFPDPIKPRLIHNFHIPNTDIRYNIPIFTVN